MELREICFLKGVLDFSKDNPKLDRLYNNAYTILVTQYGVGLTDGELVIDETLYPRNHFIDGVLAKNRDKIGAVTSVADPVAPPPKKEKPLDSFMEPVKETPAKEPKELPTPEELHEAVPIHHGEQFLIVHRHKVLLVNDKNPSDVHEWTFDVLPMNVKDDARSSDIVVLCEHNGVQASFVSKHKQTSIEFTVDDTTFMVRGCWENRRFDSFFYLKGEKKKVYTLKDQKDLIAPAEIDPEVFTHQFVHGLDELTVFILPHGRLNEPSGIAKVSVVIDDGETREVYPPTKEALIAHINEKDFRIYGRWTKEKEWLSTLEGI